MTDAAARFESRDDKVLAIVGRLGFASVAQAWREGEQVVRQTRPHVLDLAGVERADSAGLACVLALLAAGQQHEPGVSIRNAPESLRALAQVSGAEKWLAP